MFEKLLEYEHLGNSKQIIQILELLNTNDYSKKEDLEYACSNINYSFNRSFNGLVSLLSWLNIIRVSNTISINKEIKLNEINIDISILIIEKLSSVNELKNLINSKNLIFDNSFIVKNSGIDYKYSQFRNILIALGFFVQDTLVKNHYLIGDSFTNWFASQGIECIEASQRQKLSLKAFKNKQKQQEIAGLEAEKFVLDYELMLRGNHPSCDKIKIISEEDVNAGYDILSYKDDASILLDKLIEVKSYSQKRFDSNNPYFYWSSNEAEVAKKEKGNYYLYIINRDIMFNNQYKPIIINNPYEEIFYSGDWIKEPQSWLFRSLKIPI